jgi:hypothetical protein
MHFFTGGRPLATRDKIRETRQRYWACSSQLAEKDFGWVATLPLKEGLQRTIHDWEQRRETSRQQELSEPRRDRIIKTATLSVIIAFLEVILDLLVGGVNFDGLAQALGYQSAPWWLPFVAIMSVFSVSMSVTAFLTARRRVIWQFLAGAAIGVGLELANQLWLDWWEWNPNTLLGRLPGPWLPALTLGGFAGLYPIIVNALVRASARRRLRLGGWR